MLPISDVSGVVSRNYIPKWHSDSAESPPPPPPSSSSSQLAIGNLKEANKT